MTFVTLIFIINSILLILHEIESAYWREWEILRVPGQITGFIILHIPILLVMMYGLIEIEKQSFAGNIVGVVLGAGGLLPFIIHMILVRKQDKFNLMISKILIYANLASGLLLIVMLIPSLADLI